MLVNGLKPHPPLLSSQKIKCSFLDCVHFWWSTGLVDELEPHLPLLSSQKNEMLIFWLCSTSDDQLGWSMDLNPICQPSPANKMKCYFVDYVQLLMLARLVDGLKPHPPPLSSQTNEMLLFGLCSLLMISQAGRWTQTPSITLLQPIKWNAHFWITFNFWWLAGLVNGLKLALPPLSSQKHEMLLFGLRSTSDDRLGWSMDSNPIHHPFPAKKMKSSFLYYVEVLVISRAGWWTRTPSATPLQPKKWNAHFWILFKFWWLAGLVDGLEPHPPPLSTQKKWNAHFGITFNFWWLAGLVNGLKLPLPPLCSQKNEMLIFGFCSNSDDWLGWLMDSNPIHHPSAPKKMKCSFWIMFNFWWSARLLYGLKPIFHLSPAKKWNAYFWITFNFWWLAGLVDGLEPHPPPLSTQKKWNAHFWIMFNFWWLAGLVNGLKLPLLPLSSQKHELLLFGLRSTSDDRLGWSMDSNPIHHPSPAKTVKCSFLYYIQHVMLARLVNGLEPHPPPLCTQKNEMVILDYVQLLMISQAALWTETPSATPLQPKTWNAYFWITFNFWWSAGLVNGLKPHSLPLSSQKMKCSNVQLLMIGWAGRWTQTPFTSLQPKKWNAHFLDFVQILMTGWAGWWTRTPSTTPLHPKIMKCSFLDYVQLLMIGQAGQWTETPSATPLQPITWNATFWITFNFWWSAGLVNGLKPHPPPLSSQNSEMLIFVLHSTCDVGQTGQWTWTSSTTPLHPKKWNGHFGLCSTSDDWLGWSMDWNSLCHPSPAKNMKCYFLDYIQLLMIGWAGQWTQTPSSIPLQPKQWNAHFCITFNMWCWPDWSMDLNLIHHPSAPKKMKWSFWIMFNFWWSARLLYGLKPIFHLSPAKKWNAYFWITFNFWWSAGLLDGLEPDPPPISSLKIEMLIFWLCSTSDDRLCWSMDSNPSHHCSPAKK